MYQQIISITRSNYCTYLYLSVKLKYLTADSIEILNIYPKPKISKVSRVITEECTAALFTQIIFQGTLSTKHPKQTPGK